MSDRLGAGAAKAGKAAIPIKTAVATPMPLQRCNRTALIALLTAARRPLYLLRFIFHDLLSSGVTGRAKCYAALLRMRIVRISTLTSLGEFASTADKTTH